MLNVLLCLIVSSAFVSAGCSACSVSSPSPCVFPPALRKEERCGGGLQHLEIYPGGPFFLPCLQQCGLAFIAPQRKDTIIIQTLSHHGRIERSLQGGPCLVRTVRKGGCLLDFLTEVRVQVKTRVLGSGQDLHFVYPRNWSGLLWVSGEAGSEFH